MKKLIVLAGMLGLLGGLGSCVLVTHDDCREGAVSCDGEVIEQCVDDQWREVEDCWWRCGGTCDFDQYGRPICVC